MTTAWGQGLSTTADDGTVLDTWFPYLGVGEPPATVDPYLPPAELEDAADEDPRRKVRIDYRGIVIDLDAPPTSTPDAYLRLHLLSRLLVKPNELNLDGIFPHLPIVVWTTAGPMHPDAYGRRRMELQRAGISVLGIDKFPRLLDYVVPDRVRIADASRVRLGAHLAPGTTVMHEGF